jgi:hypothetical protein
MINIQSCLKSTFFTRTYDLVTAFSMKRSKKGREKFF